MLCCTALYCQRDRPGNRHVAKADAGVGKRIGAHLVLPQGWTAQPLSEAVLFAGPPSQPVLRVQVLKSSDALPTVDGLLEGLRRADAQGKPRLVHQVAQPDASFVTVSLATPGSQQRVHVFLGARRVEQTLFLCSTEPGVSREMVGLAEQACRELGLESR